MAQPFGYDSYPPTTPTPTALTSRQQRTWPALLTLFLLSPIVAEMLTGSTPPLMFINPISLLFETGLYGSGAILIRELVRRRGLGWSGIVLLGAAYGILEEGLVVTSWFNPYWSDLGKLAFYGRLFDTSWVWALELTIFHAVVSITIPILLTELLFPRIAYRPWLGKRGMIGFWIWLTLVSLVQLLFFGFLMFRSKGYTHPPLLYLGALLLAVGFTWLGLHMRKSAQSIPIAEGRSAPGLWTLRLLAIAVTFAFFFTAWALPNIVPIPIVPCLVFIGIVALSVRAMASWARRPGWGAQQHLALATGVIGFFVLLAPLIEFVAHPAGKITSGMTLANLAFLVGLILLARSVGRRVKLAENRAA